MDDKTFVRRCIYTGTTVVAIFIVIALLWNIREILTALFLAGGKLFYYISPMIYAFIMAYILYIPLSKMEDLFCRSERIARVKPQRLRIFTILLTYLLVIALIVVILSSIYIMIGGQLSKNTDINQIVGYVVNYISNFELNLPKDIFNNPTVNQAIDSVETWFKNNVSSALSNIGETIAGIGSTLMIGMISLIISIYFLMDYENLTEKMSSVYGRTLGRLTLGRYIYSVIMTFNNTFKQFLRGQLTEACMVAGISIVALQIAGVSYSGVIGIIAGICNLIPFVGPWIGAAVAVVVSLLGGSYMTAIWAVVAMIIVQQIDNHLLAPKVVGESVGLHPVITMVVLIVGADMGGVAGMLLAVPAAATVKNLIDKRNKSHEAERGAVAVNAEAAETDGTAENKVSDTAE